MILGQRDLSLWPLVTLSIITYYTICKMKRILKFNVRTIVSSIFVFFSLCPFLFPIMSSDVQPYAFALALTLLPMYLPDIIKDTTSIPFALIVFLSLLLFLFTDDSQNALQLAYGYISFGLVGLCSYFVNLKEDKNSLRFAILIIIILWFFVGFCQTVINRHLFAAIISNSRTTAERGVFGLASEPSFFGAQCFYFLFLTRMFERKKELVLIACISIMAILFAQSMLGVLFVTIYIILFVIDIKDKKLLFFTLLAFLITIIYFTKSDNGSRLSFFINDFLYSNGIGFSDDESSNVRLNSILNSWHSALSHFFIPQGFTKRYGSLIGDFLLAWGIIGIPFVVFIIKNLCAVFSHRSIRLLSFLLFFLLLNSNLQISNPILAYVIGYHLSFSKSK